MPIHFNPDFSTVINDQLPVRLRLPRMLAWLNCLVQPVKELYLQFSQHRQSNLYLLSHNSQVVYLQAALNDTFDPSARRIFISDNAVADPVFLYLRPENKAVTLGKRSETSFATFPIPTWLYSSYEVSSSPHGFIVNVPAAVTYDAARMRALIDRYRLPSKMAYTVRVF